MNAIVITGHGKLDLQERPDPVPATGQVLVRVYRAGMNSADWRQSIGQYPAPPGWPSDIPGLEVAGIVESLGADVSGIEVGDRVMALTGGGGHAQRLAIPANLIMKVPESLSWEEAAGFPEAFCTAWDALVLQAHVQAGDRVLVTGAAGGVGTAMIQVAAVSGAHVVASVRSTGLHDNVRDLLSNSLIDVITPDQETEFGPFDIIIDLVGGPETFNRAALLRTKGRLMLVGMLDEMPTPSPYWFGPLMMNRAQFMGTTIRGRTYVEKSELIRDIDRSVVPLVARGQMKVPIDSVFEMSKHEDAYAKLTGPGKFGKIIISTE